MALAEEYGGGTGMHRPLAGGDNPNFAVLHEKPEHRMMLILKGQGCSNQEIAKQLGYGYNWVCQVVRQPWFKRAFIEMAANAGKDKVEALLDSEKLNSLDTLIEVRDDTKAKGSERVAAANAILDRAFGKPVQHVKTEKVSSAGDQSDMAALEKELNNVRERQQALNIQRVN